MLETAVGHVKYHLGVEKASWLAWKRQLAEVEVGKVPERKKVAGWRHISTNGWNADQ